MRNLLILPFFLTACAGATVQHRVDPKSLGAIDGRHQTAIDRATTNYENAREVVGQAETTVKAARVALAKAKLGLGVTEASLDAAEDLAELASELGRTDEARQAETTATAMRAQVKADEALIEWREALLDEAGSNLRLALAQQNLADGELESARAKAAHEAGDKSADLALYGRQVSELAAEVSAREKETAALWEDTQEERKAYEAALALVPQGTSADELALRASEKRAEALDAELRRAHQKIADLESQNARLSSGATP